MKLLIDSAKAFKGSSLNIKISGFSIEISEGSSSGKIAITDNAGEISIEVLPVVEDLPVIDAPIATNVNVVTAINNITNVNESPLKSLKEEEKSMVENVSEFQNISEIQAISPDVLFKKLVVLRRKIAEETNLPHYIIFHDTTLKDMVSKMPVDLDEMKEVSGVGIAKLEKYGVRFVDAIKEYLAHSHYNC